VNVKLTENKKGKNRKVNENDRKEIEMPTQNYTKNI